MIFIENTIDKFNLLNSIQKSFIKYPSCKTEKPWLFGKIFSNYLRDNHFYGKSGTIEFNKNTGQRQNTRLIIINKSKNKINLVKIFSNNKIIFHQSFILIGRKLERK